MYAVDRYRGDALAVAPHPGHNLDIAWLQYAGLPVGDAVGLIFLYQWVGFLGWGGDLKKLGA